MENIILKNAKERFRTLQGHNLHCIERSGYYLTFKRGSDLSSYHFAINM